MGVRALWLPEVLAWTGYPVFTLPGWETAGRDFRLLEVVVGHHTATSAKAPGDYPSTNVILNGTPAVPPRLAQVGLGRSGAWFVFGAGVCNHAGVSAYAGFADLNDEALGIEAESPGDGTWTDAQRDSYPRGVAALLHKLNRPARRYASHRTVALPSGRKPDPAGIADAWMHDRVAPMLANPASIHRLYRPPAPAPVARRKEPDVTYLSIAPGDHVTIPRPRGGKVFIDLGTDDNGLSWGAALPEQDRVGQQQVRVAVHKAGGNSWRPITGTTNPDPHVFWMPTQRTVGFELAADEDLAVIRNMHPGWALGVTITHEPA